VWGYAAIDSSTGKTCVLALHSTKEYPTTALDDTFRLLQAYKSSEYILVCDNNTTEQLVLDYLELRHVRTIHMRSNRLSIAYQNELCKRAYTISSFLSPIEFLDLETQPLASEALCHTIEFIVAHDAAVIRALQKPHIVDLQSYVHLGNNPLHQLTIVSQDTKECTVASLFAYTMTTMGKRLWYDRIYHPIIDEQELNRRYDLVDSVLPHTVYLQKEFSRMYDLERIARRIRIGTLHPFEINFLHETLLASRSIFHLLRDQCDDQTCFTDVSPLLPVLDDCLHLLDTTFLLGETTKVTRHAIEESFFHKGHHTDLDALQEELTTYETMLHTIVDAFVSLIETKTGKSDSSYVQIKQLDKEGHYIFMTKSRYALIAPDISQKFVSIQGTVYALADFSYKSQMTSIKITAPIIDTISQHIVSLQLKIAGITKQLFVESLQRLSDTFSDFFDVLSGVISKLDVATSVAKASIVHRLIRPTIISCDSLNPGYISIRDLRHPLVEMHEDAGIYVPQHIVFGDHRYYTDDDHVFVQDTQTTSPHIQGFLLYGINSSGKSSLMKSIGIAVLLAQSGVYVPASHMRFCICKEVFTRIVSRDQFEKGLSSFAVEMMELKHIFHRATNRSLILGDEISHGTEITSSIAIVGAAIQRLCEKQALFVCTTHLHQLQSLPLLEQHPEVVSAHMSVRYDETTDTLLFDRLLQPGSGNRMYGLEFAKSLHMDAAFLRYATSIRNSLSDDVSDLCRVIKKKTALYHKDMYVSSCAICDHSVQDVHHITPQKKADAHGNIGHFHKNHKYNLLPICTSCHQAIHDQRLFVQGFVMTNEGLKLLYEWKKKET
jgi:DNA mismatch repair protein MutS